MELAAEHYGRSRRTVYDVSRLQPYDLRCLGDGIEVHIEVKGSTGDVSEVRLTAGGRSRESKRDQGRSLSRERHPSEPYT